MTRLILTCLSAFLLATEFGYVEAAEEKAKKSSETAPKEEESITEGSVQINGARIPYKAVAGTMDLKDSDGTVKASVFYVSYTRTDIKDLSKRPITFCFNGGPGSSSVWLHMGCLGPRRVVLDEEGIAEPPYAYINNDYSLLDITDLVFLDPVSTGYSRPASGVEAKDFHGVDEDTKWCSEFVRAYTTRNSRWESPKFLCGESYGTYRAAAMAGHLFENDFLYLNGVILISTVLEFQTLDNDPGNDLPYILFLPTYTSSAWYHKKLPPDLQKDRGKALQEAKDFALNEYPLALLKGKQLPAEKRKEIIAKLTRLTGLTADYIDRANLRVGIFRFNKELLLSERQTIGRFDSRFKGYDVDATLDTIEYDPSADAVFGAFTATFNQYVRNELKWSTDANYRILTDVQPWSYGKAKNKYLDAATTLREVMIRNPQFKVFVASGHYDLATPFFGTEYTFDHLNLEPKLVGNVTIQYYEAGHMMYIHKPSLVKLRKDLVEYMNKTLNPG